MKAILRAWMLLCLILCVVSLRPPVVAAQTTPTAVTLTFKGALTQVMSTYLERALQIARERQAEVVILQLDTPGGSVELMENLVQRIRGSLTPVVVYVSPRNAMAGSAGTLITLAGHISAMAPETTIGAASPVGSQGEDIGKTMESKVKEVLKANVRNLTRQRSPAATRLAEQMIDQARAVTAEEALQSGLVDVIAEDVPQLLNLIDGRSVQLNSGSRTLHTAGAQVVTVGNTVIENLLQTLVNPNLLFMLLSLGIWAILIELSSPGGWVAGFIGTVCVLLAIYGMGILSVNWFGAIFLLVAFALFALEIKTPAHGLMILAGLGSFIVGALVLFNSVRLPGQPRLSIPLVVGTALFIALTFLGVLRLVLRAQRAPVLTGRETLVGSIGFARSELNPEGVVYVNGEMWRAMVVEGEPPVPKDTKVEVVGVEGLQIQVRRANDPGKSG